jgi:hypothetical protein
MMDGCVKIGVIPDPGRQQPAFHSSGLQPTLAAECRKSRLSARSSMSRALRNADQRPASSITALRESHAAASMHRSGALPACLPPHSNSPGCSPDVDANTRLSFALSRQHAKW